mmetsp:Transcript_36440/g.96118  ORF Transcript_36440/g.96118 Transcript_36440/m.96118 type:complete len:272 (+) Transcript_36440:244-1059(+)
MIGQMPSPTRRMPVDLMCHERRLFHDQRWWRLIRARMATCAVRQMEAAHVPCLPADKVATQTWSETDHEGMITHLVVRQHADKRLSPLVVTLVAHTRCPDRRMQPVPVVVRVIRHAPQAPSLTPLENQSGVFIGDFTAMRFFRARACAVGSMGVIGDPLCCQVPLRQQEERLGSPWAPRLQGRTCEFHLHKAESSAGEVLVPIGYIGAIDHIGERAASTRQELVEISKICLCCPPSGIDGTTKLVEYEPPIFRRESQTLEALATCTACAVR